MVNKGTKSRAFHARMKMHDFGDLKTHEKVARQGEFRMGVGLREHEVRSNPYLPQYHKIKSGKDCGSTKCGAIRIYHSIISQYR